MSLNNPRLFWGGVGAKELVWRKHSREVFIHNKETGEFHWFRDAQLNVSGKIPISMCIDSVHDIYGVCCVLVAENCLDKHVGYNPAKVALIWEKDDGDTKEVTYG